LHVRADVEKKMASQVHHKIYPLKEEGITWKAT